jgi:hypothetical protein
VNPRLTVVPVEVGTVDRTLAEVPKSAGVAQVIGPEGGNLLIGRPANLRSWMAARLGRGRPAKKGVRPPTDLSSIATALAFVETTSPFAQRLAFERLMARHVPPAARRDLKPAAYVHLDPAERFPRATVRMGAAAPHLFGPFKGREAALRAIASLHKAFPLRPCDYVFEPRPDLPLGLGCVYAQVRTCAAPCLVRVTEDEYRGLAARAAAFLGAPWARAEGPGSLPSWIGDAGEARGLVAERGAKGLELYPVWRGAVLDEQAATCDPEDLSGTFDRLDWSDPPAPRDDVPWLLAWVHGRRKTGAYLVLRPGETAAEVRARILD